MLDASAFLELLLRSNSSLPIRSRLEVLRPDAIYAPHLVDLEIAQVLRRMLFRREVTLLRSEEALEDLYNAPILRYPHQPLLPRIWELRATLSAYDAAYIALAETLDAPLWTRDGRLARAMGHHASVELV